ncbi:MAG: pilin [bacterium]|nr:pilin [bacterium]
MFLNVANAGSIQLNLPVIGGFGPGLSPASFINYIVIAAFAFVGISALLMLVVGGVKYLTAAVDPKAESDAKDQIVSALLGLLVVFAAIILLNTLNPDFVRLRDPGLPIFELPEPRIISPAVEGSCAITAASWRANTSCYNTVSKTYDEVLMGTQGRNCTGWGASFNIKDVETNAVVETVGGRFESDFLQASWQPKRAGTYAFEVIAGSENTRTSAESSGRLTVTADPCGPAISPGGRCQIAPSGPCTVQNLQETCMSVHAYEASGICNVESSGRVSVPSGTDLCADGNSVSWGLFQINISAHRLVDPATDAILDCPLAFANGPYTASNKTCTVRDRDLYDRCVALAINPDVNIAKACVLSCNGTRWGRWGANNVCSYAGGNCNDPIDR